MAVEILALSSDQSLLRAGGKISEAEEILRLMRERNKEISLAFVPSIGSEKMEFEFDD